MRLRVEDGSSPRRRRAAEPAVTTHGVSNHGVARMLQRVQHDWMLPGHDEIEAEDRRDAAREGRAQERLQPLYDQRRKERATELESVRGQGRVKQAKGEAPGGGVVKEISVGVAFRTDGMGRSHTDWDKKAVEAMNNLEGVPVKVTAVTLPRGASGPTTPARAASATELVGIDMLYIPGAPTANDTQTGMDGESRKLNVPQLAAEPVKPKEPRKKTEETLASYQAQLDSYTSKKELWDKQKTKYDREKGEHDSRTAYELALVAQARAAGIPTIAICAGSWRLLQAYGGTVETLPKSERGLHKAPGGVGAWDIGHGVKVQEGSMLSGMTGGGELEDVNSTHWAVASTEPSGRLKKGEKGEEDPAESLEVSATATGKEVHSGKQLTKSTVEAFESRSGAPMMGVQWHPEAYLPGMDGETKGTEKGRTASTSIFKAMAQAARASSQRRTAVAPSLNAEGRAFASLQKALEELQAGRPVAAGNLYQDAITHLPQYLWSGRMQELDEQLSAL